MFFKEVDQIVIYTDDSSDSVEEVEPPKKQPPPLIDLTLDDTVSEQNPTSVEAQNSNAAAPLVNNEISNLNNSNNPSHWTDDMIKFYNEEVEGEDQFDIEKIQSAMDSRPSLWEISTRDIYYRKNKRARSFMKCNRCCQFGHSVFQCREGLQLPKCFMCGWPGHDEPTCPRAVCLTCGNPTSVYVMSCYKCIPDTKTICSNCYLRGHNLIDCSDNWRRFHSTIGKTTIETPQNRVYKPPKELWCCNCARKGHNQINCRSRERNAFPDTFPYVVTYDTPFKKDIYGHRRQQPAASTSASGSGGRERSQSLVNKRPDAKLLRNLIKSTQKKRKRRKKTTKALSRVLGVIHCE